MKQFSFRLQKVMEATETREEIQKKELARAMREYSVQEQVLDGVLMEFEDHLVYFRQCRESGKLRVSDLSNLSHYTNKLRKDISINEAKLVQLSDCVDDHRAKLLEITRDKKALEKLKDKRYEEYKKKIKSLEQKFMDELSLRNSQKKNGIYQ